MQNHMPQLASIKREGQPEEFGTDTGLPDGYVHAEEAYPNTSGFIPVGYRLLVMPISVPKKSAGGIELVEETTGRDEMAQIKGRLIAVGDGCWKDTPKATDYPQPGDQIVFGKYAGLPWLGHDGGKYRILNDTDVIGLEVENAS